MNAIFTSGFLSMFFAMMRIFSIIVLAGYLVRKKIIKQQHIDALSGITVMILLPALVIGNTLQHFSPSQLSYWWVLPLLGVVISFAGLILAALVFFPNISQRKNLLAIATMQNAGYLVLPIGQVVYPEQFKEFTLLTFLFILGYNPVLWTLGKYLVTMQDNEKKDFNFKKIWTPPAVANILSLLLVLFGLQHILPEFLIDSADFLGKAAVPIATFVLGATLGSISFKRIPRLIEVLKVLLVKYILIPLLVIGVLWYFEIGKTYPLLSDFLIIQAAAAPATGLILQVRTYGGDRQKVAAIMLIAYVLCLIALPFWIALWHSL